MKFIDSIKKDFNTMTWVLIPVAIAINVVMGQIVVVLKLPVYLDSIGTMLVGALCGPWAGALTGTLSNIIWGLAIDPNAFPWWPVAFFIGLVTGLCARAGLFKNWWKVVITGFLVALTAAIVSTPIAVYLYGGITASGSSFITAYLLQTGQGVLQAVFSTNFLVEPVDKISTALLAFAIVQGLSKRFLARFPRPENVEIEEGATRTQMYIAIGVVIALVLFAAFVLVRILG
jgi:energy-coupling factor transport system substrate-specific component